MGKAEKGTPKDIAKRMKAKGLQKLKYYCQMCEKQCRDANGFKCHLTSESHLRQMKIFSDNANGILDSFSKEFETMYMSTLRMRHGTKRVNANNVYQEVIADKHHIHMNATKWVTLSEFVQYLGKTGKCVVEETERGWYVSYIERDANILARQEALERRQQAEREAEIAEAERMKLQRIEAAKAFDRAGGSIDTTATNMERKDGGQVKLALVKQQAPAVKKPKRKASVFGDGEDNSDNDDDDKAGNGGSSSSSSSSRNHSHSRKERKTTNRSSSAVLVGSIDQSRQPTTDQANDRKRKPERDCDIGDSNSNGESKKQQQKKKKRNKSKERSDRKDYWLKEGILVRIVHEKLENGKYFRRKAVVDKVIDRYMAEVEVLDSSARARDGGDVLRLDQDDLETVIPSVGKRVRILNGPHRGEKAVVKELNKDRQHATLELERDGRSAKRVAYEDFSKLA